MKRLVVLLAVFALFGATAASATMLLETKAPPGVAVIEQAPELTSANVSTTAAVAIEKRELAPVLFGGDDTTRATARHVGLKGGDERGSKSGEPAHVPRG